jgi:hypothetical protein
VRIVHRRDLAAFLGALPIEGEALDHAAERAAAARKLAERRR